MKRAKREEAKLIGARQKVSIPHKRYNPNYRGLGRAWVAAILICSLAFPPYAGVSIAGALDGQSSQQALTDAIKITQDEVSSDMDGAQQDGDEAPDESSSEMSDETSSNTDFASPGDAAIKEVEKISESVLSLEDGTAALSGEAAVDSLPIGTSDINKLWTSQAGGTSSTLTITEGGTYALSANLKVSNRLIINAPGQDITIDLRNHVLSASRIVNYKLTDTTSVIDARKCRSLTIIGSRPFMGVTDDTHKGPLEQLVLEEGSMRHMIDSSADELVIRNVGIAIKAHKDYTDLSSLDACGVYANKGKVNLDNCSVFIDHSTQCTADIGSYELRGFPKGVYAANAVSSLDLSNCSLRLLGSPAAQRRDTKAYSPTMYDNVYGVYAAGTTDVHLRGGSISVSAPHGSAIGACGKNLNVGNFDIPADVMAGYATDEVRAKVAEAEVFHVAAEGGERAFGLSTLVQGGITIDASFVFTAGMQSYPTYQSALVTTVENGIVFGSSFAGSGITVLAGDLSNANTNGFTFGSFAEDVNEATKSIIVSSLANGLEEGACTIGYEGDKLTFELDESKAVAVLVKQNGSEVSYNSIIEALKDQGTNETVRLCKDSGALTISESATKQSGGGERTLRIDLNGHALFSLAVDTSEDVRILSSGESRGRIYGYALETRSCVSYGGSGAFSLSNVDITGCLPSVPSAGVAVNGTGRIEMDDVRIILAGQMDMVRGIYQGAGSADIALRDSLVDVRTDTPSVMAYGIDSTRPGVKITLDNTSVKAASMNGITGAINCNGILEATGDASKNVLSASTQRNASTVFAVCLSNSNARAKLTNATLEALCTDERPLGAYWCLMSGADTPLYSCSWTLGGACSFASARDTHVNYREVPVGLSADFSTQNTIRVLGANLENGDAFTGADNSNISQLSNMSGFFEAVANSEYDGWYLAQDGDCLRWSLSFDVAENIRTHQTYQDVSAALKGAKAGDTIRLVADCEHVGPIAVAIPVTLDLNGKQMGISLSSANLAGTGITALSFESKGSSKIMNGTLTVRIAGNETLFNRSLTINGIDVQDDAELVLDALSLKVFLGGNASGRGSSQVNGIHVDDAALLLSQGTCVQVTADTEQAVLLEGIRIDGTSKATVNIDASSQVDVQNEAQRQRMGSIANSANSSSYQLANLMRFYPEEGSDLYNEIQEKFKRSAKIDVAGDPAGFVYGERIYYATPLELDDGTYVWAYSDQINVADIGKEEAVKASVFYSQSYYDAMPDAYAIVVKSDASSVSIAGTLSAASSQGSAVGVLCEDTQAGKQRDGESIVVDYGARINVSGAKEAYRAQSGTVDLHDVLGINSKEKLSYPGNTYTYEEICWKLPTTVAIDSALESAVKMRGIVNANSTTDSFALTPELAKPTKPINVVPSNVKVVFDNLHGADGSLRDPVVRDQVFRTTIAAGGEIPQTFDYVRDGITYRFIGWMRSSGTLDTNAWNPSSIGEVKLDNATVTSNDTVMFYAVYVPVAPGAYLATFDVGDYVRAYAPFIGTSPDYRFAIKGSATSVPIRPGTSSYEASSFAGWRSDGTGQTYAASLPRSSQDVAYEAAFNVNPSKLSVNVYGWLPVRDAYIYTYDIARVHYGESGKEELEKIVKPGDVIYDEAQVHSFMGWSSRRSDKFAYYGDTPPSVTSNGTNIYAIYDTRDRIVPVSFYVDGELYAEAPRANSFLTVNGAFGLAGAAKPSDKAADKRFVGWSLKPNDTNYIRGAVKTLASLAEAEEPLKFYAVYGAASDVVDDGSSQESLGGSSSGGNGLSGGSGGSGSNSGSGTIVNRVKNGASVGIGAIGGPVLADPTLNENVTDPTLVGFDEGELDGSLSSQSDVEVSPGLSFLTLVFIIAFIVAFALWWLLTSRRNRRLDEEDDFYEPDMTGEKGERFVF